MTEREKHMLVSEVNILRELRHTNIVRYHDRIIDRATTTIYIIMEYCPGGDLAAIIKDRRKSKQYLSEKFVRSVFRQLVSALKACHDREEGAVLHRDLKPANIFIDAQDNAKLGDFGLARVLSERASLAHTFVGSPYYMSPELITEKGYNEKSDMWSLGCLIYELAALRPPFDALNQSDLSVKIKRGTFERLPSCFSDQLEDVIRMLLHQDASRRPSIDTLISHPYLQAPVQVQVHEPIVTASDVSPYSSSSKSRSRDHKCDVTPTPRTSGLPQACGACCELHQDLQSLQRYLHEREAALRQHARELEEKEKQLALREKYLDHRAALRDCTNTSPSTPQIKVSRKRYERHSTGGIEGKLAEYASPVGAFALRHDYR